MLDAGGRLRRFTPSGREAPEPAADGLGPPDQRHQAEPRVPDLDESLSGVIDDVESREREVQDQDGNWYLMRVRPYRTMDNRIDGAVIAFFDIDPIKRSLEQVNRARDYAEALVETVREALVVLDENLRVRTANESFYRDVPDLRRSRRRASRFSSSRTSTRRGSGAPRPARAHGPREGDRPRPRVAIDDRRARQEDRSGSTPGGSGCRASPSPSSCSPSRTSPSASASKTPCGLGDSVTA